MASSSPSSRLAPPEGYRLWANTYDSEPNPILSLEKRILEQLLPPLAGLDVVDLGCGTGRWLEAAERAGAGSLFGVDSSPEMLKLAKLKLGDAAALLCGDCVQIDIAGASADLVFCNFVLSYVADAEQLLNLAAKVLRPGGVLFLTDVHPETAAALGWRRGVRAHQEFREIRTYHRDIATLIFICRMAGLEVSLHLEPKFGDVERLIFERNGKLGYFEKIREHPATYVLQLIKPEQHKRTIPFEKDSGALNSLRGGRIALGPTESFCGEMRIRDSRVKTILCAEGENSAPPPRGTVVDLRGYLLLPGLINAHDHLEFALFPRMGAGGYRNFLEWAEEIHRSHASEIALHRQVPKRVRLWWGGIHNLLCGVTTVCHHNPHEPEVFAHGFVIRVLRDFGWAHSLALEPETAQRKKETPKGHPFFIHLAEGVDEQSGNEIFDLDRDGALDANTVIIHGLGIGEKGKEMLRRARAGLVWCPSSNLFLFGKSMSADEVRQFPKVALGSDSPLTAQGDLLDEIRCAHQALLAPVAHLYNYVLCSPAQLLRLRNGEGTFRVDAVADLVAVRDIGLPPAETLSSLSYKEIELVLLGGRVQLASEELKGRLHASACEGLQPLCVEGIVRWIRAPLACLFEETMAHLGESIFLGGRKVRLAS